jgi:alkylated DNA repair dioxygenase AlkB
MDSFEHSKTSIPSGLELLENYISADDERKFIENIDKGQWSTILKRRTQHFGYEYDYKKKTIQGLKQIESFPDWCLDLTTRLKQEIFHKVPEQLIINEYQPGQGISKHIDSPVFGEPVVSLSLGSQCVMIFTLGERRFEILLPQRSLLVLRGESRWDWTHEIPARKNDKINGQTIERTRRISMTFRILNRDQPEK